MIQLSAIGGKRRTLFGTVADRVNMLIPAEMAFTNVGAGNGSWGPSDSYSVDFDQGYGPNHGFDGIPYHTQDTQAAANHIDDWKLGKGPYPQSYTGLSATVSQGATTSAPDGTTTGRKIVETSNTSGGVGIDAVKPAAWTLATGGGGTHADWDTFWTNALAVVPAWEGTGNPHYYKGNPIVDGGALTAVNGPAWGTTRQGPCLRFAKASSNAPDWRIPASGGNDIAPLGAVTYLLVRKPFDREVGYGSGVTPCSGYRFGLTTSADVYLNVTNFNSYRTSDTSSWVEARHGGQTNTWIGASFRAAYGGDGRQTTYQSSVGVEIWAYTSSSANGGNLYFNGKNVNSTAFTGNRGAHVNSAFGLNTANYNDGNLDSTGGDVLFFAILNTEWSAAQIQAWARDPYAPIRIGVGAGTAVTPSFTQQHYLTAGWRFPQTTSGISFGGLRPRYRLSVFAKAAERKRIMLWVASNRLQAQSQKGVTGAVFDLENGVIGQSPRATGGLDSEGDIWAAYSAAITPYGRGWYRCDLDFGLPVDTITDHAVRAGISIDRETGTNKEETDYFGDGTSGVYLWKTRMLPIRVFSMQTRTLYDDFTSINTIDVNNTKAAGYKWYVNNHWPAFGTLIPNDVNSMFPNDADTYSVSGSEMSIVYHQNRNLFNEYAFTMSAVYTGPTNFVGPDPGYRTDYYAGTTFTIPFAWESRHKSNNIDVAGGAQGGPSPPYFSVARGIFGGYSVEGAMTPAVGGTALNGAVFPPANGHTEIELAESDSDFSPGSSLWHFTPTFGVFTKGSKINAWENSQYHTYLAAAFPSTATELGLFIHFVDGKISLIQHWYPGWTQDGIANTYVQFENHHMMIAFGGFSSVWDYISAYR